MPPQVVMTDPSENIKLPINEPANGKRKSQIQAPPPPPLVLSGHAASLTPY